MNLKVTCKLCINVLCYVFLAKLVTNLHSACMKMKMCSLLIANVKLKY